MTRGPRLALRPALPGVRVGVVWRSLGLAVGLIRKDIKNLYVAGRASTGRVRVPLPLRLDEDAVR